MAKAKKKRRRRTPVARTKQERDAASRTHASLPDRQLLEDIAIVGGKLLRAARNQLSTVGPITDDDRWGAPFPLRFELQFALLTLGALDAYDVAVGILRNRASQQAFGPIRFQMETVALMRWMTDSTDTRERQARAYRVLCGQISRWARFLMRDAGRDRDALQGVHSMRGWGRHLQKLAAQDGVDLNERPPKPMDLLTLYAHQSGGYPTFSMLSELGSHPVATGNILFSLRPDTKTIDYTLEGALVHRAFWCSASIVYLWETIELAAEMLDWKAWLEARAQPLYYEAASLMDEARKRRRAEQARAEEAYLQGL